VGTCWYCGPSTHEKASLGGVPPLLWACPYSYATCLTTSKNLMTSPPPLSVSCPQKSGEALGME
jgi:hypothetical protein